MRELREVLREVVQATLPVVLVVVAIQAALLRLPAAEIGRFLAGAIMVVSGLLLFLLGARVGLLPIGEHIGSALTERGSAAAVLAGAFVLGLAITVAEPDVRVLAYQVDLVSGGTIAKNLLIAVVALGVAVFVLLSFLRIMLRLPLPWLLAAGYLAVFILSLFTPPEFLAISFDAGGVTTGPVTVPFILALGLGVTSVLGGRSRASDGFGLIGLASIGPVLAVMILGVIFG